MRKQKITYSQVGDNYDTKDPIKKLAQNAAAATGRNLIKRGFEELASSRGESAYVWKQGNTLMATMIEGLGTKTIVADDTRKITGKTYYDVCANDTVAYIINDLISVGAKPLTIHAYWAIEDNSWLADEKRMRDLIRGWQRACDLSCASWGGGETATDKGIIVKGNIDLAGSAVGIIGSQKRLVTDKNLKAGDRILLLKSTGINASGISLARAIAKKLPKGYGAKLPSGKLFGEAIMTPCNIYANLVEDLLDNNIHIHYLNYISGHGMRKIMRARPDFTYVVEKLFEPQEIFPFIQKHANLDDFEMYQTYNMGQDYVVFLPEKDVKKAQKIIAKNGFKSLDAGYVEKGKRQVVIKPKGLIYKGSTLDLR
ncbi:MAG TPA: AIR synthase related protein [Candidatus Saccharimonadales bacterium]|nr:AIR synthase related protein [Candidatus Saccharimonadales bacterium]